MRSLVIAGLMVLLLAAPVSASTVTVEIKAPVLLRSGGEQVRVPIWASCPAGWTLLEANVSVSQGAAWGMSGFQVRCTGHASRYWATVTSFDDPFVAGEAFASAFVLALDPSGTATASDGDAVTVTLR